MPALVDSRPPAAPAGAQHTPLSPLAGDRRFLRCRASGVDCCLEMDRVEAVERVENMVVNWESDSPLGWLRRPGISIDVYPLAHRLGRRAQRKKLQVIVVVRGSKRRFALAADSSSLLGAYESALPVPACTDPMGTGALRGVVSKGDELLMWLDADHLDPTLPPVPRAQPAAVQRPAAAAAPTEGSRPAGSGRLLSFSLPNPDPAGKNLRLAVAFAQVREMVGRVPVATLARAHRHVLGAALWRGQAVPVIDAGACLGLEPVAVRDVAHLLVAGVPGTNEVAALPAGTETRSLPLPLECYHPRRQPQIDMTQTRGIFEFENHLLAIPDLRRMIGGA